MLTVVIILVIGGLLLSGGSFIFAALNMKRGVDSLFQPGTDPFASFKSMFGHHIGAMIGMFIGSMMFMIGTVAGVIMLIMSLIGG